MNVHWNKIGLWLAAIFTQAQVLYPGLNGEMIVDSYRDDTIWYGIVNILIAFIVTRAAVKIKK